MKPEYVLIAAVVVAIIGLVYAEIGTRKLNRRDAQRSVSRSLTTLWCIEMTNTEEYLWVNPTDAQAIRLAIETGTPKLVSVTAWRLRIGNGVDWYFSPRTPKTTVVAAHVTQITGPCNKYVREEDLPNVGLV